MAYVISNLGARRFSAIRHAARPAGGAISISGAIRAGDADYSEFHALRGDYARRRLAESSMRVSGDGRFDAYLPAAVFERIKRSA